ncbi:hypothetical protein HMPREF1400_00578 [Helicobacter pylori GAM119Bi]|nr:hypothetical protein HMPREF1400_00578 [Helicobacter pylori GAM119Bi]
MVLILALNHHRLVRFFCILFKTSIFKSNAIACLFSNLYYLIRSTPFNASLKF